MSAPSSLAREVLTYAEPGGRRMGWASVMLAALCTFAVFALLPFTEVLEPPARPQIDVRPVSTHPIEMPPPQRQVPRPREDTTEPEAEEPTAEKPTLVETQERPRVAPLKLNLPLDAGFGNIGDFALNFDVRAAIPPKVAEETPEEPAFYHTNELDRAPTAVLRMPPVYPYRAKLHGVEGHVELLFTVTARGRVTDIDVVESVPKDTFVDVSTKAVSRWRFEPGMKDGRPVPTRIQVRLRFQLE